MKKSKTGVVIVILAIVILLALAPWYLVAVRFLAEEGFTFFASAAEEESAEEYPDYDYAAGSETEDYPEQENVPEEEPEILIDETIINISDAFPELVNELRILSSDYNSIGVSLVAFDSATSEFFTYQFGFADMEERRHVDVETKFRVASLSKVVTAICAMVLVDEGLLDLDADISNYLGYEVVNTYFPDTPITSRMLLQHTSSIFDSGAFHVSRERNSDEYLQNILERGTSFRRSQPGTSFEYTNFGYSVLAAVVETITGTTIDNLARNLLFEPLNIDAAFVPSRLSDTSNIAVIYNDRHGVTRTVESQLYIRDSDTHGRDVHLAQSNLTISALDYARILAMLGNGGILGGVRILSQEAVRAIHNTDVQAPNYRQGLGVRFNAGGFLSNSGFYWHTGSGYGGFMQFAYVPGPGGNRGVVVLSTGATISRLPTGLIDFNSDLSLAVWHGIWYPRQEPVPDADDEYTEWDDDYEYDEPDEGYEVDE